MLAGVLLSLGYLVLWMQWRLRDLLVTALDSGPSGPSLNHGWGYCVAILGNINLLS